LLSLPIDAAAAATGSGRQRGEAERDVKVSLKRMWDVERDPAYRSGVEEGDCGFAGRLLSNSDWSRPARAHLVSLSLSRSSAPRALTLLRLRFSLFLFPQRYSYLLLDLLVSKIFYL